MPWENRGTGREVMKSQLFLQRTCLKKLLLPQANQESVRAGFYLDPMSYYLDDLGEVILTSLGLSGCLSKTRKGYVQFTALLEGLHEAAH